MIVYAIGNVSWAQVNRLLEALNLDPSNTGVVKVEDEMCQNDSNVFGYQIGGIFAQHRQEIIENGGSLLILPLHLGKAAASIMAFTREVGFIPDVIMPYGNGEVIRGT